MPPCGGSEVTSAIQFILDATRCESAYHLSVDQNLEVQAALFALSRIEGDMIVSCSKFDCLTE